MRRLALIACCVWVGGCGVAHTPARGLAHTRRSSEPTFAANQRVARAFAQHRLSTTRLPAGATSVATDPAANGVLDHPLSRPGIGHLIDLHQFWRAPGTPAALLDWLRRHVPAGTRLSSSGSGGNRTGTYMWMHAYSYRKLPAAIFEAELDFAIAAASGGGTAVRVDSFAAGLVPRPRWERVPAAVAAVVVSVRRSDGRRSYAVATVTDPARARRLVAVFNGFRIVQPGAVLGCPAILGATPQLRFRFLAASGTLLAEATESGCTGLKFVAADRSGPALSPALDLTQLLWSEHVLPICSALSVKGRSVRPATAEQFSLSFRVRDTGAGACGLRGYPNVRLLSRVGGSLIPRLTRIPAGHLLTPPVALLDPSWAATTSVGWPARPTCKALPFNRVLLRLPGISKWLTVRLSDPIAVCGRRLEVAPIGA